MLDIVIRILNCEGVGMSDGFDLCTNAVFTNDMFEISCKLGLWSVSSHKSNIEKVWNDAHHYFAQYKSDGEYDKIINAVIDEPEL